MNKFPPKALNHWIKLDSTAKKQWLTESHNHCFSGKSKHINEPNRIIKLDGKTITDELSFYCAIGEAVNGPGGYFGSDFHSFDDCLFGRFGLKFPYTIIWNNSETSKKYLNKKILQSWIQGSKRTKESSEVRVLLHKGQKSDIELISVLDNGTKCDTEISVRCLIIICNYF